MVQIQFNEGELLVICLVAFLVLLVLAGMLMLIDKKICAKRQQKQIAEPQKVDTLVKLLSEKGVIAMKLQTAEKQLEEEKWKSYYAMRKLYDVVFFHMLTPENERFLAKELQKQRLAAAEKLKERSDDAEVRGEKLFCDEMWNHLRATWHFDHESFMN